jgi:hypothetical protein
MTRSLGVLASAALSILLVATLFVVPYLPTNDGPESVLAVHIENHYGDPGTPYRDVFVPAPQFAGRGFTLLFEPLEDIFGWERGLQAALSILVLTSAWGFVFLARTVDDRRLPLAFVGFPLALSWPLYMGFFAFVFATGVGLFILAFGLRGASDARGRWAASALLAGMLLIDGFLHLFAGVLTGLVLVVVRMTVAPRGRRLSEFLSVSLIGFPAALLAALAVCVAHQTASKIPFASALSFATLGESLVRWPRTLAPGPLGRALVVTGGVAMAALLAAVRTTRRETKPVDRALSIAGLLYLLASLLAPETVPGWQHFSQRFAGLGVALLVVALPLEVLSKRTRTRVAASLFVCAAASLVLTARFHRRLAAQYADAIAGADAKVVRHGDILPVTLDPLDSSGPEPSEAEVPLLDPLLHISALYAVVEGGLPIYTFGTNPATWPLTVRADAPSPAAIPPLEPYLETLSSHAFQADPAFRERVEDELALYGRFYDGVVVTGARPRDFVLWQERGYETDWRRGSLLIAHFVPCTIDVALLTRGLSTDPPRLDVGVDVDVPGAVRTAASPPKYVDAAGVDHVFARNAPCGRVWVRARWTLDGGTGALCGNADPDGRLRTTATHDGSHVACVGSRPSP